MTARDAESVADGFGNEWTVCDHPKCDLHVVRPGKVQCAGYCKDDFLTACAAARTDGAES
jgi:hypothetical protein